MKKIAIFLFITSILCSCAEDYGELNINFSLPDEIFSPEEVTLVSGSTKKVLFSWEGGGADDGMYVQYEVLFDKKGGDFSSPLYTQVGDLGGVKRVTMQHAQLNNIAKLAGAKPGETVGVIWTVRTSKGDKSELYKPGKEIKITRYNGLSEMPEKLYLYGSATENGGQGGRIFGKREEGVFVIYTKLTDGEIYLKDGTNETATQIYFNNVQNIYQEGEGSIQVTSTDEYATRIIVDLNNNSLSFGTVTELRAIWRDTDQVFGADESNGYNAPSPFYYTEGGVFTLTVTPNFIHRNPWWGAGEYHDDGRYYFVAKVNGTEYHWRNNEQANAPTNSTPLSYFLINDKELWNYYRDVFWMMRDVFRDKLCHINIFAGEAGKMYHSIELAE